MAQHQSWNRWFNAGAIATGARSLVLALATLLVLIAPAQAQKKISAAEAKDHIGETATVCGTVASARYTASTKGQPTFLNLDKSYPNPVFTVLIWGQNRSKFGTPESEHKGKRICVTGKITEYKGAAEIVASDPNQLKIEQTSPVSEQALLDCSSARESRPP